MARSIRVRSLDIPSRELSWRFSRSSGPGGQGVNTTDSRVEVSFDVAGSSALPDALRARALDRLAGRLVDGVLTVSAQEYRSQLANRRAAQQRLVDALADALAPPPRPRRASRPSRGAVQRRLDAKRMRSRTKALRRRPPD
jgi:ribosome-associated protein